MEGKMNFVLIAIIAFLSMAVAFIVIYMVMTGGLVKPSNPSSKEVQEKKIELDYKKAVTYSIPEMIVNLKSKDQDTKSIIKLEVSIILTDKKAEEEISIREAEIRDIITSYFNSKMPEELQGGKMSTAKEELLKAIKGLFKEPKEAAKIYKVLIPNYFIQ